MNKADLARQIAHITGLTRKEAETVLNSAIQTMTAALAQGERVQLVGFGSFNVKERAPRLGRNIHTGEPVPIQATRCVQFIPGRALKEAVRGGESGVERA